MRALRTIVLTAGSLTMTAGSVLAQGGMMGGMMGRDSATASVMGVVHQLLTNHEKLRRTVTTLPNGVRTLTESDDPAMIALIQRHVAVTGEFVAQGHDPNLPMASPSLRGVLRNGTRVSRRSEQTAKGVLVTETSDDAETVRLLQTHAAEITDQVNRGMVAVHERMLGAPARAPAPSPMEHEHMPGMSHDSAMAGGAPRPTRPGQEAFATIAEIVRILDADPRTDWSRVDLEALREHLRDMDDVTLHATVRTTLVEGGATFEVQGTGRVREAVRRMAVAHGATIGAADGFTWSAVETATGARVTVRALTAGDTAMASRIRALGFVGLLTLGDHHTAHHLGIANGTMRGAHQHPAGSH